MEPTSIHQEPRKSFFEKYQTFIAIIICGAMIGGGIVLAKVLPGNSAGMQVAGEQTQESVRADLITVAKKIGVNKTKFAACLDDGTNKQKIADAVTLAQKSGVQGTPTFFVIKRTLSDGPTGTFSTEKQFEILGARDQTTFEKSIASGKAPADQPPQQPGEKIVLSDTDHWMGSHDAQVVIVEYSDIECPYCKRVKPTIDALLKAHPEYAFVWRHSPIASLHPFAPYKAEGSECAFQLGGDTAFWKYLDETVK